MAAVTSESKNIGLEDDVTWSLTDHGKRAEMNISHNPHDLESWAVLMREAQSSAPIRSRILFNRLVKQFPNSARYWRAYIEQEIKFRNYEQVEKLFQQCLMDILHIDLWLCYISYIKETKSDLPNYRDKLRQAYEFTLNHIGIDYHSSSLWTDYIAFLQQENVQGSFAENQKIQSIRKAYQRIVTSPKANIEQFWKEFNLFEQSVNKVAAKKMTDLVSKSYSFAKRASHEYLNITRGLIRGGISIPPQGTIQEMQQLNIWQKYLNWEKSNPLRADDHAVIAKRVSYAYNQCLLCFSYSPEIWYGAISYLQRMCEAHGGSGSTKEWIQEMDELFVKAINGPMHNNLLLNFAYADFEESKHNKEKAEKVYTTLLGNSDIDPTLVYVQYMNFARRTGGVKSARSVFKSAREDQRCGYHAYVAAALFEYNITKDKDIAFRVFELGMKKFSSSNGFMLSYIDHLAHLNEDNNTRVLFEKALSNVPVEQTSDIWRRFGSFESHVGDLASVLKIERRRGAIMRNEVNNYESILLVDRYKYLDLMPCSSFELKTMGYFKYLSSDDGSGGNGSLSNGPLPNHVTSGSGLVGVTTSINTDRVKDSHFVRPDVKQMQHFKPSTVSGVGMNAVPGGHFPLPSAIANMMSMIPPPSCFQGPFVLVDELMDTISQSSIPELPSTPLGQAGGSGSGRILGAKRRRDELEDGSEEGGVAPPTNDIYISRQQKRVQNHQ